MKVRFYLGKFAAYFLAIFVLLTLLDYSRVGKRTVKRLHDSAYASDVYIPSQTSHASNKHRQSNRQSKEVFSKLKRKDSAIQGVMELQNRFNDMSVDSRSMSADVEPKSFSLMKMLPSNRLLMKESGYSEGFYAYIDQRRTYMGCEPLLYPDGSMQVCDHVLVSTEKGVLEDLIVFLCNNHSLLNCIYAVDGAPVDRFGNKLIYTVQNCIAFFLSAVSGSVLAYCGITSSANIVFDIVVVTPAKIFIAKLIKALYTCPVGFSVDYQVTHPMIVKVVQVLGKLTLIPIVLAIFMLLVLAALFSQSHDYITIVCYFFLQVQLYGFFLELVVTMFMFMSRLYMRCSVDLHVRSIVLLEVGRRYTELIYHRGLVEGKDYHYRCYYLFCVLRVECIYRFDDAIKKGYVTEEQRLVDDDVELTVHSTLHTNNCAASDDINQEDDAYLSYDTYVVRKSVVAAEQASVQGRSNAIIISPLHNSNATSNIEAAARINTAQIAEEADESDIPASTSTAIVTTEDDDHEYDYTLTDEGYVRRRKEFKPQTRASFVETFRRFEESEQLATISPSSAGSERRVDFLHKSLKKNTDSTRLLAPKR